MPRRIMISEARESLFDLFDEVTHAPDRVIYIQHRNRKERAALTSEEYLRFLETTVQSLRSGSSAPEFSLFGSGTLHVAPDDVLKKARQQQAELAATKRKEL